MNTEQLEKMRSGHGFIAALDQSGGSTPKALRLYGVNEDEYSNDASYPAPFVQDTSTTPPRTAFAVTLGGADGGVL